MPFPPSFQHSNIPSFPFLQPVFPVFLLSASAQSSTMKYKAFLCNRGCHAQGAIMFRYSAICLWLFVTLLVSPPATCLGADEPDLKQEVAKLFETGWQPSLKANAAADEQFAKLDKLAPVDRRIPYAHALVKIRQRKYAEASRLVEDVVSREPHNWHAWRTKIWLSMLMKNYDQAMAEMDRVAQLVAAVDDEVAPEQIESLQAGLARFLGRMFGYLDGPAGDDVPLAGLDEGRRSVEARLSAAQREVFAQAQRTVTDRFAELTGEGDRTREQALADAEARKEQIQDDLRQQEQRIDEELGEIDPLREKFESEFQSEMADLREKERPLLERLTRLEAQAARVRNEAAPLAAEIDHLERRAARERDEVRRRSLLREADRIAIILRRYEAELLALDREYAGVNAQRARLLAQAQQAQARYQRDMGHLQARVEGLRKELKKIDLQERNLSKPATGNVPRARELDRVAKAFTTYEQLPLEAERRRILDSFD